MLTYFANHAFIAAIALLLHGLFAGLRRFYAGTKYEAWLNLPVRVIQWLERKLNRSERSVGDRRIRGGLVVAVCLTMAVVTGLAALWLVSLFYLGVILEILLVTLAISLRPAVDRALEVHSRLQSGDLPAARHALAGTAWRNYALLDEHGVARAAMEKVVVDFADKTVSPLGWYLLLGLPGVLVSRALNLLAETLRGHRRQFGYVAYRLDHWLHFIPGQIAALLLALAALFLPFGKPGQALAAIIAADFTIPARNGVVAAAAYALNVTLGGPADVYADHADWIGSGSARVLPRDILRALILTGLAALCLLLLLLAFSGAG